MCDQEVHKAACASLTTIFFNCVSKDFVAACVGGRDTPLHQTILVVDTIVQYKYQVCVPACGCGARVWVPMCVLGCYCSC